MRCHERAEARWLAWLVPAGRRDWIEAVWAEAYEVPAGLPRLAWRAGGTWMVAREVLRPRKLIKAVLFTAAAAAAVWAVGVAGTRPGQSAPLYLELDD